MAGFEPACSSVQGQRDKPGSSTSRNYLLPVEVTILLRCCQRALYHLYTNRHYSNLVLVAFHPDGSWLISSITARRCLIDTAELRYSSLEYSLHTTSMFIGRFHIFAIIQFISFRHPLLPTWMRLRKLSSLFTIQFIVPRERFPVKNRYLWPAIN